MTIVSIARWSIEDPLIQNIANVYARSWLAAVKAAHGSIEGLAVEVLRDPEYGDVIVRLSQG